jgi:hypothetical protein
MLMVLRQWRRISGFELLAQALFEQLAEWLLCLERSVCGSGPRPLAVLVGSPLSRSRGGPRTHFSVEVPSTRPAWRLPSAPRPFLTVPSSE